MEKDGEGWRRLAQITNDEIEEFRLNFSRRANRDVAPLLRKGRFKSLSFTSIDDSISD